MKLYIEFMKLYTFILVKKTKLFNLLSDEIIFSRKPASNGGNINQINTMFISELFYL